MKKVIWLVLGLGLTLEVQADIYTASMNSAHRAVNKTEAASNADPDAIGRSAPSGQAPQPADPAMNGTLNNIAKLRADLASLSTNTPPPNALTNDLMAAANGTKASLETVRLVAADLQATVPGQPALKKNLLKLAQFLHASANGAHLTPAQFQMLSDGVEKILSDAGVSYTATQSLLDDLKRLVKETK